MANKQYISDELLAAYLEGNTNKAETLKVLNALKSDPELQETLHIALKIEENNPQCSMFNAQSPNSALPMLQLAAESGENICSVLCEAYILNRRNMQFDEQALADKARSRGWLKPKGAPLHSIGQLLAGEGLMVTRKYDATLADITEALEHDNDVIVAVDRDKLYPDLPDDEDATNHAIIVTAIESKSVRIYDPRDNAMFNVQCSMFNAAWKESRNYMVRVLQSASEYKPQPINLEDIALTDDLMELREAIAENAHDVWAAARIKEGWTYGPVRDDKKKQHPDLLPYSALPDSEKEYDRLMALDSIKLVKKLGFDITKK